MTLFAFSLRALRRDLRAGDLRVLALALVVAVASVTAVGFFSDRVRQAMERQAGELLAADLVVDSRAPLAPAWRAEAARAGLRRAATVTFRSVVVAGERVKLTEVKAVGAGYPLRGTLRIADRPYGPSRPAAAGPAPGTVWLEARLLPELGLAVGDSLQLGDRSFRVAAVLTYEPDRGGDLFSIAPRVMMNLADLPATGLIQTGSLARYHLLLAGAPAALQRFERWARPRLGPGERLVGVRDARPELRQALDRAGRFLGLAALVSVLLAGAAVAMAARRYARRHLDAAAVMRCLGAGEGFIVGSFLLQLLWLALFGAVAGIAAGYLAQAGLARILADFFARPLPAPSPVPAGQGLVTALVTLAGFAVPPVLALRGVPPLRVLRRDLAPRPVGAAVSYAAAAAALLALLAWEAGDTRLTLIVFAGTLGTLALLAVAGLALVRAAGMVRLRLGLAWRFGVANIARRAGASVAQLTAFGLGITVLLMLALVRNDLLAGWRATLPAKAPNHFVINIQPDQVKAVRAFFADHGLTGVGLHPMVRGRLTGLNGHPVSAADYSDDRAKHLVRRDFNLSWSAAVPGANRVVAGRWWDGHTGPGQWSVEEGLAGRLGIKLGDRLTFTVAGRQVSGTVSSLRKVDWDSFRVNFFVLAPPGVLDAFPASYVTSFYLSDEESPLLADLVRRFPNLTVIDVGAIMSRVRTVIDRASLAVEFVSGFTLLAGLMVLYAAIEASHDERLREAAILRTLGARHGQVRAALVAEFVSLGALAGLLAAAAATAIGFALARFVFQLPFMPDPWVWAAGLGGGALGVGLAGLLGTRSVLRQPPLWTLRRLE